MDRPSGAFARTARKNSQGLQTAVFFLALCALAVFGLWQLFSGGGRPEAGAPGDPAAPNAGDYVRLPSEAHPLWEGSLVLVNRDHAWHFPDDQALISIYDHKTADYYVRDKEVYLSPTAMEPLNNMLEVFYEETGNGHINVIAGWRSYDQQDELLSAAVGEDGADRAYRFVAQPGYSEHHTGLAVDFALFFEKDGTSGSFDGAGDQAWLLEHAGEYGFVRRYASGKESVTGIGDEPWHFRYVGVPHAGYMAENGLCLEEYLALLRQYSWDGAHLAFSAHGAEYEIYFCETGSLYVPQEGDFTVSGNGYDGYVVTITK